jgi:hypothetical protein
MDGTWAELVSLFRGRTADAFQTVLAVPPYRVAREGAPGIAPTDKHSSDPMRASWQRSVHYGWRTDRIVNPSASSLVQMCPVFV